MFEGRTPSCINIGGGGAKIKKSALKFLADYFFPVSLSPKQLIRKFVKDTLSNKMKNKQFSQVH